jgi:hypothetical protein
LLVSHFSHGLRRGLHSYAASRLKIWSVTPPRRRNSSSHAHTEATAPRKIASKIESFRNILESKGNLNGSGQECPLYTQKWPGFLRETWGTQARFSAVGEGIPQAMGRGRENFPTQAKRGLEWGTRRGRENFPTQAKRGLEWGTRLYRENFPTQAKRGLEWGTRRGRENFPTQAKKGLEWGTRRGRENFPTQAKKGLELIG